MNRNLRKIGLVGVFTLVVGALALYSPMVGHAEEYALPFEFSPNSINIASERTGDVRVLTKMKYTFFVQNGDSVFIYFNDCPESVQNIQKTRDSLGNLILKFSLEDLLVLKSSLVLNAFNAAKVVITMNNGDEYIGEGEVYINDKKTP